MTSTEPYNNPLQVGASYGPTDKDILKSAAASGAWLYIYPGHQPASETLIPNPPAGTCLIGNICNLELLDNGVLLFDCIDTGGIWYRGRAVGNNYTAFLYHRV
jgi:hypothetical protein